MKIKLAVREMFSGGWVALLPDFPNTSGIKVNKDLSSATDDAINSWSNRACKDHEYTIITVDV